MRIQRWFAFEVQRNFVGVEPDPWSIFSRRLAFRCITQGFDPDLVRGIVFNPRTRSHYECYRKRQTSDYPAGNDMLVA